MGRKRFSPEQTIVKLREAEIIESKGLTQVEAAKKLVYLLMVGLAFTAYQVAMVEAQGKPNQDMGNPNQQSMDQGNPIPDTGIPPSDFNDTVYGIITV